MTTFAVHDEPVAEEEVTALQEGALATRSYDRVDSGDLTYQSIVKDKTPITQLPIRRSEGCPGTARGGVFVARVSWFLGYNFNLGLFGAGLIGASFALCTGLCLCSHYWLLSGLALGAAATLHYPRRN